MSKDQNTHLRAVPDDEGSADDVLLRAAEVIREYAEIAKTKALIAAMRDSAVVLELFNDEYRYDRAKGGWSPESLRYEADYLERHLGRAQ